MPASHFRPRCPRRLAAAVAWAVTLFAVAGWAQQEPVPVHIEYEAPPVCPRVDGLFEAVRARTPIVTPASPSEARRKFRVVVTADAQGARAEVSAAESGAAVRVVEGASCGEVIDAIGLTIALAVDPDALVRSPPTSTPPVEPAPPSKPPPPSPPETPPRRDTDRRPAIGHLGGGVVVARLADVGPSWGGRVFADLGVPRRAMTLRLTSTASVARSEEAILHAVLFGFSVCPVRLSLGRFSLLPGAEFEGGFIRAESRGLGLDHTQSASRSWWGAAALLRAEFALVRRLSLEAEAATSLPFVKRRFVVEVPPRQIAETHAPALWAGVGFSVPF